MRSPEPWLSLDLVRRMRCLVIILALSASSVLASDVKQHTSTEWRAIMAKFVFTPKPDYPAALQYEHIEGSGYFRMHMDTQGKVA